MILSDGKEYKETGYDYLDDYHAVQRATGEVVDAYQGQIIVGSIIYTPEEQQANRERKERESCKAQWRTANKPLGDYYFADAGQRYRDISPQTMARLTYLGTFLPYNSNVLQTKKGSPMRKGDIESVMHLSTATFFRFWREVFNKYLFADDSGHIFLADTFRRGKIPKVRNHTNYQKIYIQSVRGLYESVPASKHRYLGYIFQLLPYINTEYNILCFTPDETNIDAVTPMTVNEFCSIIGVVPEKRARVIKEYSEIVLPVRGHSERFCSFVLDGLDINHAKIFVNPHILYRGNNWEKVAVLGAFTIPKEDTPQDMSAS